MAKIFEVIEHYHNAASDTNFVWFPFLFLKLKPNEFLDSLHVIKMTIFFAGYFNLAYLAKRWIFQDGIGWEQAWTGLGYFLIGFYIWFNLVTKNFWNRRARRLNGEKSVDAIS